MLFTTKRYQTALHTAAYRTAHMSLSCSNASAGQNEGVESRNYRLQAVCLMLQPCYFVASQTAFSLHVFADTPSAIARRGRKTGSDDEQPSLYLRQKTRYFRIGFSGKQPYVGIQFVNLAAHFNAYVVLHDTLASIERGGAIVAKSGIKLHNVRNLRCNSMSEIHDVTGLVSVCISKCDAEIVEVVADADARV